MSERKNPVMIIVRESLAESLLSDAGTFTGLILSCLIGYWLDIPALSWIGGILLVISVIYRSTRGYGNCYTIEEAKAKIAEIEAKIKAAT